MLDKRLKAIIKQISGCKSLDNYVCVCVCVHTHTRTSFIYNKTRNGILELEEAGFIIFPPNLSYKGLFFLIVCYYDLKLVRNVMIFELSTLDALLWTIFVLDTQAIHPNNFGLPKVFRVRILLHTNN